MFESHGEVKRPQPAGPDAERDVKIEHLLLTGLDHYFKGRFERAIDIWTRVLFLDRSHARARAYIDRARAALAERMRESDEILHTGVEAFERGNVSEARELVTSAIEHGGGRDEALALLDRVDRLETAAGTSDLDAMASREVLPPPPPSAAERAAGRRPVRVVPLVLLCGVVVAMGYLAMTWEHWVPSVVGVSVPAPSGPATGTTDPLPVPAVSEVTLLRAQRLLAAGRHHDALNVLASIGYADPRAAEADSLRTAIQQELLARAGEPTPLPTGP